MPGADAHRRLRGGLALMKTTIEIVCCSLQDCVDACRAGADRIELCSTIELGGLTPSIGLLESAKQFVPVPIMAMIRPRAGGFCYSDLEFETMLADIERMKRADGYVFGCLTADWIIDIDKCKTLVAKSGKKEKVFHRAFDKVKEPLRAMETLIDLGFTRILTSGLAPTADDGLETLELLRDNAKGRIEIMPGGGIRSVNAPVFLHVGFASLHLAPRVKVQEAPDSGFYQIVDSSEVEAIARATKTT